MGRTLADQRRPTVGAALVETGDALSVWIAAAALGAEAGAARTHAAAAAATRAEAALTAATLAAATTSTGSAALAGAEYRCFEWFVRFHVLPLPGRVSARCH